MLVSFHGHVISGEGVEVDLKKTDAVRNWPRPLTPNNIKNLLGLAGYYGRDFDRFSSIAYPLTSMTQNKLKLSSWKLVKKVSKS